MEIISASPSENLESDKLFGRCGLYSLRLQLALNEGIVALDKRRFLPCRKIIIFIENVFIGYPRIENFLIAEASDEEIAPVGERGIIGKFPCVKGRYPFAVGTEKAHFKRKIMRAFAAEAVREDGKAIGAVF